MKVSALPPPNWEYLQKKFGFESWEKGPIVTYGDTAHFHKGGMPPDLHIHEEVHVRQQAAMGVEKWFNQYLIDPAFRLDQEVEAYRCQKDYIVDNVMNHKKRTLKIDFIHECMVKMYDGMVSLEDARRLV